MKTTYKIQASTKTLIRWSAQEVGIKNAKRMLSNGSIFMIFGAKNGVFKTKKEAINMARRIEMMAAYMAGKLGKTDYESVKIISNY